MRSFVSLAIVVSAAALAAQQPQQPTFSANVKTVAVYATVTNAQGRLVPDLRRDDFTVFDDGKQQTLTLFANEVQPITVVMLLDRSGSMKPNYDTEEQAAEAFVRAMGPNDKARIGSFAMKIAAASVQLISVAQLPRPPKAAAKAGPTYSAAITATSTQHAFAIRIIVNLPPETGEVEELRVRSHYSGKRRNMVVWPHL